MNDFENICFQEILWENVIIKSVKYQKSKESTAVELRDTKNAWYILKFGNLHAAKKFMDNDQVSEYITDNKVGLMHSLRKLLGKFSSLRRNFKSLKITF